MQTSGYVRAALIWSDQREFISWAVPFMQVRFRKTEKFKGYFYYQKADREDKTT